MVEGIVLIFLQGDYCISIIVKNFFVYYRGVYTCMHIMYKLMDIEYISWTVITVNLIGELLGKMMGLTSP